MGKVLHVVGFGDDVPEQLLCLFRSGSQDLHIFADTLCRSGVCCKLGCGEKHSCAVVQPVEFEGSINKHVHEDMVTVQTQVGDLFEKGHRMSCVGGLDRGASEGHTLAACTT